MAWQTLIDAYALMALVPNPKLIVVDCRFDLFNLKAGERAYVEGHIPSARYAHLEHDLSDLSREGRGRHPLPEAEAFCAKLVKWGITPNHHVVAYDDSGGMFAARFWWMMRLLGHREVAVLDGGLKAWIDAGGALESGVAASGKGQYAARFNNKAITTTAVVAARLASGNGILIDARAAERFRGEVEPLDPRAGHVPGAINRPFQQNLDENGHFLDSTTLRDQFKAVIGEHPISDVVHMCGSGVSACHNLLAMEHAGLTGSRIYAGSWSEWVIAPLRPVATGAL